MKMRLRLREIWGATRWKIFFIFGFFSVASVLLVALFSVALLNVIVRRESAYLMEERIKVAVDNSRRGQPTLLVQGAACGVLGKSPDSVPALLLNWSQALVSETPEPLVAPSWLNAAFFAGVVRDEGVMEIRSFHAVTRGVCTLTAIQRTPLTPEYLRQLSSDAGLQMSDDNPVMLKPYRAGEGLLGEIEANFVPGSRRPIPIVVVVRNWRTGLLEDWVVCQVRPSYSRTIDDLSHMGLRPASWVTPFGGAGVLLTVVYGCGLFLSVRLSRHIVTVIDALTEAALQVGRGDFSVRVSVPQGDQLAILASSFNDMTAALEGLREQEQKKAALERDVMLAHEVQQYLYPPGAHAVFTATVSGVTSPARIVSGDLYDFFAYTNSEIGLLCADISGKGISAALMMAHLRALLHGRLQPCGDIRQRPEPPALVSALNSDCWARFGGHRYATLFYGEFDARTNILRYVNAGHCSPIYLTETGEPIKLAAGDLPVGLFSEVEYQELRVTLPKGSAMIVYTDGVTDALNSHGEDFGENRLMRACRALPMGASADAICELLLSEVLEWSAGVKQHDDTTILVLKAD
jgi:serine phosphatase RsbU (regulator of sigma subunit)